MYQGHFFQPGHRLARCSGVGGAAAASGMTPAHADWPDDPLASNSVSVWPASALARAAAGLALARAAAEALTPLARAGAAVYRIDIHSSKLLLSIIFPPSPPLVSSHRAATA